MTKMTAANLFFGALGDLGRHPAVVLRIALLPALVLALMEIPAANAYIDWLDDPCSFAAPPSELLNTVAFFFVVGAVAVSWHRFMLLDEAPGTVTPRPHWRAWGKYILAWIVLGVIVGLIVLVAVVAPLFLIGSLIDPVLGQVIMGVLAPETSFGPGPTSAAYVVFGVTVGLVLFAYLALLFRMSMGLPSARHRRGGGRGCGASWRRTRPLARPILGLAVLAMVGQIVLSGLGFAMISAAADTEVPSLGAELAARGGLIVVDTINTLIGAAILTRIYRALPSTEA